MDQAISHIYWLRYMDYGLVVEAIGYVRDELESDDKKKVALPT